eukprot:TRINITY_DN645_c0_g1_i2.p3 TRINITY_DN645_c0_g1~~TRINITY_DN645_c0_g1_i2.p3  ORF type:complete len:160 (-),score=34.45 TRINITY_DN645_c0_g1_i2:308-787(-)
MGIAAGLIVALYTNGFVMTHLYSQFSSLNQSWMPYVYAAILGLIGCLLALRMEKLIIIAATSFGGAYLLGFGVIRLAWKSTHADLGPMYLFSGNGCEGCFCKVALLMIVCVGLVGMLVQYRRTADTEHVLSRRTQDVYVVSSPDSHVLLIRGNEKGLAL